MRLFTTLELIYARSSLNFSPCFFFAVSSDLASTIRRIDLESDAVTTSFLIPGHVVDFHGSAKDPNLAYIALHNVGGSIFMLMLSNGNMFNVGAMNTGPLGALGRIRSLSSVDDSQVFVAIDNKPGLFSLVTSSNPIPTLRAGSVTVSGDVDGVGTASRFGIVKHLCRSPDLLYIYLTTWSPFKVLRYNTITREMRTIAGLPLSQTPTIPVPIDGYPPKSALAWPTTIVASLDGLSLYVLEYYDALTNVRYDQAFLQRRVQQWFELRHIALSELHHKMLLNPTCMQMFPHF